MSDRKNTSTRVVTKKATPKLSAEAKTTLALSGTKSFPKKEAFCVVIASDNGLVQMTYHHPIGITELDEDSWIATESEQIHYLFERKIDPRRKTTDANRQIHQLAAAVTASLLERTEDGEYVFHGQTAHGSRKALIRQARLDAKDAGQNSPESYIQHLPDDVRELERQFRRFMVNETVKANAAIAHPYPAFATRSGLHATQEQVAVAFLEGKDYDEAREAVINRLLG